MSAASGWVNEISSEVHDRFHVTTTKFTITRLRSNKLNRFMGNTVQSTERYRSCCNIPPRIERVLSWSDACVPTDSNWSRTKAGHFDPRFAPGISSFTSQSSSSASITAEARGRLLRLGALPISPTDRLLVLKNTIKDSEEDIINWSLEKKRKIAARATNPEVLVNT